MCGSAGTHQETSTPPTLNLKYVNTLALLAKKPYETTKHSTPSKHLSEKNKIA